MFQGSPSTDRKGQGGDLKPNPEARLRPHRQQVLRTDTMSTYYSDCDDGNYAGGDSPGNNPSSGDDSSAWSNLTSNEEVRVEDERRNSVVSTSSHYKTAKRKPYLHDEGDIGRVVSVVPETHNRCCKNRYWCISDVCGMVCVVFTWLLVFYAEFVVVGVILWPAINSFYSAINFFVFQSVTILALCSHTRTMLTDPGAVPRGNATKENIQRMGYKEGQVIFKCPKCCSIKPERAHHCSVCQRCIRKMDHHCPWVNNCVGENNQKYFVLFTLYIAVMSFHSLFMAINHFISCLGSEWHTCPAFSPPATIILLLFLMFEGLLFALFTSIMFGTQVSAIWHDQTGIESLKKEEARWVRKSRWKSIQGVFGRFSIHWFSPFAHVPPPSKSHGYLFSV